MPLAEHETVAVCVFRVRGIYIQNVKIQSRKHVQTRKVATDVSRLGIVDNFDKPSAVDFRLLDEFVYFRNIVRLIMSYKFKIIK